MSHIILSTDRLNLRTWQPADVAQMSAISADPLVMEYFPSIQNAERTQQMIEYIAKHFEQYGYGLYAVELKNTGFIGFVGLDHPAFEIPGLDVPRSEVIEIGWRLSSKHWNKGYATEAAKAVLHYAFTTLNIDQICSFTTVENHRSRRVMEKIGLHHSKTDDFDHPNIDMNHPLKRHVLYRLKQSEYKKFGASP